MKLSEVLTLQDKMPVMDLEATIEMVFERKTGTGQYGDWSIQNVILVDDGLKVQGKLTNCPDVSEMKGCRVNISATETKHGLNGAKMGTFQKKTGESVRQIEITKSGRFQALGTAPEPQTAPQNTPNTQEKAVFKGSGGTNDSINRAVSLKAVVELINYGKIELDKWYPWCTTFERYLKSGDKDIEL